MRQSIHGISIGYLLEGPKDAPVVMLSHSLGATREMWRPQIDALRARYRVVAFDTRGHGDSDAPPGPYSFDDLVDDAVGLLDALGISRAHFVGLSLGGMIGQRFALRHEGRLASLTLADTASEMPEAARPIWAQRIEATRKSGMNQHVEPAMERWFTAAFRQAHPEIVDPIRHMVRSTAPEGYIGCCHAIKTLDFTAELGSLRLPTLVVVGAEDQGTPVASSELIQHQIDGARLVVIDGAAHLSNIEQAAAFNHALLDFLDAQT